MSVESLYTMGHEEVIVCQDPEAGYRAILALHSTVLGPATGGTRLRAYDGPDAALMDALRLSRAMTYKNAAAGLALGGGKAVILAPSEPFDREQLFLAHGRAVDRLGGRFITGEDVGTGPADFEVAARQTQWVAGFDSEVGPPSSWTARGVMAGIVACAEHRWGTASLEGRTIAIQGCGNVGAGLSRALHRAGARLVVCDVDQERARDLAEEVGGSVVEPTQIYEADVDLFAPCALGAVLNDQTIPRLRAQVVAGAANNQLAEARHAAALADRGILFAPDFVINAGGVIAGSAPLLKQSMEDMVRQIEGIAETLHEIFDDSDRDGLTTLQAAERRAEQVLARARANHQTT